MREREREREMEGRREKRDFRLVRNFRGSRRYIEWVRRRWMSLLPRSLRLYHFDARPVRGVEGGSISGAI